MKKVLLILVGLVFILCLTGCGKKKITVDELLNVTGKLGYIPTDVTSDAQQQFSKIVQSIHLTDNDGIEIEFSILEDINSTLNKYNIKQREVEKYKQDGFLYSTESTTNYESYALNTKEKYFYISRVDETYLYIKCDYEDKEEIVSFVEEIGY